MKFVSSLVFSQKLMNFSHFYHKNTFFCKFSRKGVTEKYMFVPHRITQIKFFYFFSSSDLSSTMAIYSCDGCVMSFESKSQLDHHRRSCHQNEVNYKTSSGGTIVFAQLFLKVVFFFFFISFLKNKTHFIILKFINC